MLEKNEELMKKVSDTWQQGSDKPIFKRVPEKRHFPRNLRNKPCLCGATKGVLIKSKGYNSDDPTSFLNESLSEPIPVKAKHCCLPKVNASYHSSLEKYMPNTGKRKYGN